MSSFHTHQNLFLLHELRVSALYVVFLYRIRGAFHPRERGERGKDPPPRSPHPTSSASPCPGALPGRSPALSHGKSSQPGPEGRRGAGRGGFGAPLHYEDRKWGVPHREKERFCLTHEKKGKRDHAVWRFTVSDAVDLRRAWTRWAPRSLFRGSRVGVSVANTGASGARDERRVVGGGSRAGRFQRRRESRRERL